MNKILLILLILICLSGCAISKELQDGQTEQQEVLEGQRFYIEKHGIGEYDIIRVITDTETGEQYLFYKSGYGAGMTRMGDGQ